MAVVYLILGCCIWLPLMVWIVSLIHWMVTGDVDVLSGLLGIWLAITLGYVALKPPIPALSPLSFLAVVVTIVAYPFVRSSLQKRELRQVDIEALERAYNALAQRPGNELARFGIAQRAYQLGLIGHAVAIADDLASRMPESTFRDEHRILRRWKQTGVPPESLRPITCADCGENCPPGWVHCAACGSPFLLDRAKGRIVGNAHARRIIAGWFAMVACLAGIPLASSLAPGLAIAVILLLLISAGTVLFIAFKNPGTATT